MDEDLPGFDLDLVSEKTTVEEKQKSGRFASYTDGELDGLVEESQAKTTKYSTKYAVTVFKGNETTFFNNKTDA